MAKLCAARFITASAHRPSRLGHAVVLPDPAGAEGESMSSLTPIQAFGSCLVINSADQR
jgi:hypothetical protein